MSQNAPHMLRRSIIGIFSAVLFIACGLVCMPSQAFAAQPQTAASTGTQHRQVLSLSEATAVVTDTSGYHLKVTITNTDSQQWQAGQNQLFANQQAINAQQSAMWTNLNQTMHNQRMGDIAAAGAAAMVSGAGAIAAVSIDLATGGGNASTGSPVSGGPASAAPTG